MKIKSKIAFVTSTLEFGGLRRALQNLFELLEKTKKFNLELIVLDKKSKTFTKHVSFFNTTVSYYKKIKTYQCFSSYIASSKFNYIIDFRFRINPITECYITQVAYAKQQVIYTIHSANLQTYLPKSKVLCNWYYKRANHVVCVSNGLKNKIANMYRLPNLITIYNPVVNFAESFNTTTQPKLDFSFIIAVGRVEAVKQFDKLIHAYAKTNLRTNNIKLVIVGDGSQLETCKEQVNILNLENHVIFTRAVNNPEWYMNQALATVLCSKYEGLPMALIESLICGTPVISFDLETGPNEIVQHKSNGLLVKNQDFNALAQAMEFMVSHKDFHKICKANAKKSALKFSEENILNQWLAILQ